MFIPSIVRFDYNFPFTSTTIRLRRVSDNVALAGASVGVPPIVNGHYEIVLATHGLTPAGYPELIGVELVATVQISDGVLASLEVATASFTFQLAPPLNVVAV